MAGTTALILVTRIDTPGLFRMPRDGGPEELVLPDLFDDDWGNWVAMGIYFLLRYPTRLAFYAFATGHITELGPLQHIPVGMVSLSLTPDQKTLAFVQQRYDNADLWMIDDFE